MKNLTFSYFTLSAVRARTKLLQVLFENRYTVGVCGYPINLGTRFSGRVRYLSGRVLVFPRNNRVPGRIFGYPSRLRISELIGYATQLGHSMRSGTCCNFREILRTIDEVKKFRKFVSTKNL